MSTLDIIQGIFKIVSELQAELENQEFSLFYVCGKSSLWIEGEKIDRQIYLAARLKISLDELISALDKISTFHQCQALSSDLEDPWDLKVLYCWANEHYFVVSGGGMNEEFIQFLTGVEADSFIAQHGSQNN